MARYLVIFKSHAEGLSDLHFVDVAARSPIDAVKTALSVSPPFGSWALAQALPWPRGCARIADAALRFTGT